MSEFVLIQVSKPLRPDSAVRLEETVPPTTMDLRIAANGDLSAQPADRVSGRGSNRYGLQGLIGHLRNQSVRGEPKWYFSPRSPAVALNGVAPLLPVVQLTPGDVISVGRQAWFATRCWTPTPVPAPDTLAHKPCPVCGVELSRALVVQCPCGRWMHLERADDPENPDALNCFLVSKICGGCQRPTTLEPQMIPELPEPLCEPKCDEEPWEGCADR